MFLLYLAYKNAKIKQGLVPMTYLEYIMYAEQVRLFNHLGA
jgi:hypothetical protein